MQADRQKWIQRLPAELRGQLARERLQAVTMGRSGTQVFRADNGYLKISPLTAPISLLAEQARLLWLQGRLPVPRVLYYGADDTYEYLLQSEIPGTMACEPVFKEDMPELIRLLAEALHRVHAVAITHCPFDMRISSHLTMAQQYLADVGEAATEKVRALYEQVQREQPAHEDLVFTHGDFCLPNILLNRQQQRVSGFIDWELGGIADRHRDLERACWSLAYNFDEAWIPPLLEAYGLEKIDQEKLAFYRRLEDLRWRIEQE